MFRSLREYITALSRLWFYVIPSIILGIIGVYQLASGNQLIGIPPWVWLLVAFVFALIIPFIPFHKVRVQRDEALGVEQSLALTPHEYAIGLTGMTGYPIEPDNTDWLHLKVAVNYIGKPIDTLDLLIGSETIPVNNWHRENKVVFDVYFNITEWRLKGKNQVELIAHVGNKKHSSGRINIDFDIEPGGLGRRI